MNMKTELTLHLSSKQTNSLQILTLLTKLEVSMSMLNKPALFYRKCASQLNLFLRNKLKSKFLSQEEVKQPFSIPFLSQKLDILFVSSDIIQECDIVEDVCIAFGYNNIQLSLPKTPTVGKQLLLNKMSDLIREEIASAGYKEGLNFVLVAKEDLTTRLNKVADEQMVIIDNPNVQEFSVGRTTLLPGCLKWLSTNKKNKVFL